MRTPQRAGAPPAVPGWSPHYRRAVGNPRALTPNPQCRPTLAVAGPHPGCAQSSIAIRRSSAVGSARTTQRVGRLWSRPRSNRGGPKIPDPGAPYRPSDVETTTFFDRRDFPPRRYAKALPRRQFLATPGVASRRCRPPPLSGVASLHGIRPHRFRSNPARSVPVARPAGWQSVLRLLPVTRASGASPPRQPRGRLNYSYVDSILAY